MSSYKPQKLNQDYLTRSAFLQLAKKYIWNWGMSKTTMTRDGKIIGATAPLWLNPSTLFYKLFCFFTFLCFLLFIGFYIFLRFFNNNNENASLSVRDFSLLPQNVTYAEYLAQTSTTNSTALSTLDAFCLFKSFFELNSVFVLIGAIIIFLNFFHATYLGCYVDYASDKEWSRNLYLNTFLWLCTVGITIGLYIYSTNLIAFFNSNYDSVGTTNGMVFSVATTSCNRLFEANMYGNLLVAIFMTILDILQFWKIFQIWKNFFMVNYVEHSARCEDENIIVIA